MTANPPAGNITFLFTDIEGSTKLAQQFPDTLHSALEKHHAILREAIESNNGFVFEIIGDAFCAAFENAYDAVNASYNAQLRLNSEEWNEAPIKVRMGIHSGYAEWNGKRYMGYVTLARTQRIMSAAYGGQVLVSENAYNQLTGLNEITFRDLGARRLKDLIQPLRIYQLISKELPSDFPPLKTLDARPNNLSVQLTSFIGKDDEIRQIKELLKNTHLLTITGSGGAGKTRLALQVGADVIDDFPNGVWFVELASVNDSSQILQAILKTLGVMEVPGKTLEETLTGYLKDKEMLIILDNCEHIIKGCAILVEKLLTTSPKLKILATSRQILKCLGEQTHRVMPLEIPPIKKKLPSEILTQYEAVRLFIERALTINPRFRVNNDNAPALAGICVELDGIPLAIELAAARTNALTVQQIYERFKDFFNLLKGGRRTALPRQQTLRAAIDWSYDYLKDREKILWRRLSVFNGGWTFEAAEAICSDEAISKEKILDLLSMLVENSIIIFEEGKERYRMLETIRQYGEEKLVEANEADKILFLHLYYYMELSESAEEKLKGNDAQLWLDKLELEHDNLKSAIEWSIKAAFREEGMRLAGALNWFWHFRGYRSTGRQLLENLLRNQQGVSKFPLGKALYCAGWLALLQGEYQRAEKYLLESLDLFRELDDTSKVAGSLRALGSVMFLQGNYEQARKFYDESLVLFREMGNKIGISHALNDLGNVAYCQGNYQQAWKFLDESLALCRESGDKTGISNVLNSMGIVAYAQGNYEQAWNFLEKSLALCRETGDKYGISFPLDNLGDIAYVQGNYEQARKFHNESLALYRETGDKYGISYALLGLGTVAYAQGNYEQARKFLEESLALCRETGNKSGFVFCVLHFAEIDCVENCSNQAARLLGFVETAMESMGIVLDKDGPIRHDKTVKILHEKLSDKEFSKYRDEGKKLTFEQAAELCTKNVIN